MGIYLHIPFCRKRCHFCYFKVYTDKNASEIDTYLNGLKAEIRLYGKQRLSAGRKPVFVYFGGGTPSYLSTKQLGGLVDVLQVEFPLDETREITFECEPGTLTEGKLEMLRNMGVTRLSLGIENFTDEILVANGRAHVSKEIFRAYDFARKIGFPQINVDLIAGMVGETEANWQENIRRVVDLAADSVTIYQMEVPYNTTLSKQMRILGQDSDSPVADWPTKRRWVNEAFAALGEAGYSVASAYTAVRDAKKTSFLYRDMLWAGADMLGTGVASFSHANGVHYQNQTDLEDYLREVNEGRLPIRRALTPTPEECFIREMVLQMKLGHLNADYFHRKFGVDVRERFGLEFKQLQEDGFLRVTNDGVELTRDGLLQVDRLLHRFFLPQHRNARLV